MASLSSSLNDVAATRLAAHLLRRCHSTSNSLVFLLRTKGCESPRCRRRVLDQYEQGRTCCRNGHCPTLKQRTQAKTAKLAESPSLTDLLRPVLRGSGNGLHREERVVHSRQ